MPLSTQCVSHPSVHANTISTYLEAFSHAANAVQKLSALVTESHNCIQPGDYLSSWVNQDNENLIKLPNFLTSATKRFEPPGPLSWVWHSTIEPDAFSHFLKKTGKTIFCSFYWHQRPLAIISPWRKCYFFRYLKGSRIATEWVMTKPASLLFFINTHFV